MEIRLNRVLIKVLLGFSVALLLCQCTDYRSQRLSPEMWEQFKENFIVNGRVVDTANQHISHSEGQGYAMLFAVYANDPKQFSSLWEWTQNSLQRPDRLFSWRYSPCPIENRGCVTDNNNATDGDILIAWSLFLAAKAWDNNLYRLQALAILNSIKAKLIRKQSGYTLLMPAEVGFENKETGTQVNLSYWVFPALETFTQITADPIWQELYQTGEKLLQEARFGKWQLPPDWVILIDDGMKLDGALSPDYGYNACRIPIYLVLSEHYTPELITPFLSFWSQTPVPATVNLQLDTVADYQYPVGMEAIALATRSILDNKEPTTLLTRLNTMSNDADYYSTSLIMLAYLSLTKDL